MRVLRVRSMHAFSCSLSSSCTLCSSCVYTAASHCNAQGCALCQPCISHPCISSNDRADSFGADSFAHTQIFMGSAYYQRLEHMGPRPLIPSLLSWIPTLSYSLANTFFRFVLARAYVLPQASSSKSKFETEIDHKNTQLKHFRDEVEEMMVAIEVIHG